METKDFNLAIADKHQLKYYGLNELGISLSLTMSESTMRQRIVDHCAKNDIEQPSAVIPGGSTEDKKSYVKINIAKQDKPGGSEPAFVGVQGVGYSIPRGLNIDVPKSVVEVLKNAKQDIVTQDPEDGEIMHEEVLTFPFQIVSAA